MRARRLSALALALLSIVAFCVADANLGLFIVAVPGTLAAWYFTQPPLGRPLPRIVINIMLLGILAYTLITIASSGFTVTAVCEIITLTLIAKILDRRSHRDRGQVISISVFLCIGTILTSNGFWVGMLLIGCLGLLVAATVSHQIERVAPADGTALPAGAAGGFRTHRRRLVAVMFAGGLVLSVLVFLLIPRKLGAGLFGEWGNPGVGQVTGFADEVELGTPGLISQSSTPVLDFEVVARADRKSLGGPGIVYYLRGAVLDEYEDGRWTRDPGLNKYSARRPVDHMLHGFAIAGDPKDWTIAQTITVRNVSATRSHLFSVWRPVFLEPAQPGVLFTNSRDGTIIRESDSGKFEYTVLSRDFELRTRYEGGREWSPAEPVESEHMDSARFAALATKIVTDAGLDPDPATRPGSQIEQAASAIRDYFSDGFVYTLEAEPVPPRRDPTEWFLFEHKAGHCEYYASAMAALCRSIGINARVITGYVATEYNEATGHYVVRQSNAHAWVEAEVGPGVWYTFDPTPAADFQRVHKPSDSLLAQARRLLDAAEYAWIRAVVGFDAERQRSLVRSAFKMNWTPDRALENFAEDLRTGGPRFALKIAGGLLLGVSFLALVSVLASRYRGALLALARGLAERIGLALRPREDVAAIYRRLLRELARRGRPKPPGVPLLTHVLAAFEGASREERDAGERLARALYRARFRGRDRGLAAACARDLALLRSQNLRRRR
jgi:transglutaminase-like putative cysteine protease